MAMFRILCVKFQTYIRVKMDTLAKILVIFSFGCTGYLVVLVLMASIGYGYSPLLKFCHGYSTMDYQDYMIQENIPESNMKTGKTIQLGVNVHGMIFVITEFVCYIILFLHLKKHNKSVFQSLQKEVVNRRSRRNTITLVGNFVTFVIEILYSIFIHLILRFGAETFAPGVIPCIFMCVQALITVTQILTSPELRRFYLGHE